MTQGKKFDPNGLYVRKWLPELAKLPNKYIHEPWLAPQHVLDEAGVKLDETYPKPIVDHKAARVRFLDAAQLPAAEILAGELVSVVARNVESGRLSEHAISQGMSATLLVFACCIF